MRLSLSPVIFAFSDIQCKSVKITKALLFIQAADLVSKLLARLVSFKTHTSYITDRVAIYLNNKEKKNNHDIRHGKYQPQESISFIILLVFYTLQIIDICLIQNSRHASNIIDPN